MCLSGKPPGSRQETELSRAIMSWSLASIVFCLQEPWSIFVEWNRLPGIGYTRNATDPFSKAVLSGLIGDTADTAIPYMLLHLLDWQRSDCLASWPFFLTHLAKWFRILVKKEIGRQSADQVDNLWHEKRGERFPERTCYAYTYRTDDGKIECCYDEKSGRTMYNIAHERLHIECPPPPTDQEIKNDQTNESMCHMGQLALYLSMWRAGTGNSTGAWLWIANIYTKPLETPDSTKIKWHESCLFHGKPLRRRQTRFFFPDNDRDPDPVANYETDGIFDHIANAAVDILRGYHHNAIQKGRFSEQGAQEWLGISKSMAQLLLGPGMQKAASQDADFADFLVRSGNPPEGNPQEIKRALRAWDTYGKRCPGRVLRQTIVDYIGWFTPQGALPWSCWVDNPLSMMCPAVQSVARRQEEAIESRDRGYIAARFWKFWGWKSG